MSPTRTVIWIVGVLLVIAGLMVLFFETGLANWVPATIAGAGLLLIIGMLVLSFARTAPEDQEHRGEGGSQTIHKEEHHHH